MCSPTYPLKLKHTSSEEEGVKYAQCNMDIIVYFIHLIDSVLFDYQYIND